MAKVNANAFAGRDLSALGQSLQEINNPKVPVAGKVQQMLPVELIYTETQPRKVFDDIDELAESMKQEGLIQAISVMPADKNGKYRLIQGERRLRAARLLGWKEIEAVVWDNVELKKPAKLSIKQLIENVQRKAMRPLEIADTVQTLVEAGISRKEIEQRLGKKTSWVQQYCIMGQMPNWLRLLADRFSDTFVLYTLASAAAANEKLAKNRIEAYLEKNPDSSMTRKDARAIALAVAGKEPKPEHKPAAAPAPTPTAVSTPAAAQPTLDPYGDHVSEVPPAAEEPFKAPAPKSESSAAPKAAQASAKKEEAPANAYRHGVDAVPPGFTEVPQGNPQVPVYWETNDGEIHSGVLSLFLVSTDPNLTAVLVGKEPLLVRTSELHLGACPQ